MGAVGAFPELLENLWSIDKDFLGWNKRIMGHNQGLLRLSRICVKPILKFLKGLNKDSDGGT